MTPALAARAQVLLDRRDILDCVTRYCRGLDRLDPDITATAFHADAQIEAGEYSGGVTGFLARSVAAEGAFLMTAHHITTHLCEVDGDVAFAESYLLAHARTADGRSVRAFGGRYLDRFERRAGVWRIAHRRVVFDLGFRATGDWLDKFVYTNRDRGDPSYHPPFRFPAARQAELDSTPPKARWDNPPLDRFAPKYPREVEGQVRYLEDRQAILDCVALYCRGCDRNDRAILAATIHPGGKVERGARAEGHDEHVRRVMEIQARNAAAVHHITNHNCELTGDTAIAESYVVWTSRAEGAAEVKCNVGRYIDRLEKRDGKWKIVTRRLTVDIAHTAKFDEFANYARGAKGDTDPSYRRAAGAQPKPSARQPSDASIATLTDRLAIRDCLVRYPRGLDRLDIAALASTFHPDGADVRGTQSLHARDFMPVMIDRHRDNMSASSHNMTATNLVDLSGDIAHAETYVVWFSVPSKDQGARRSGSARYLDRLERRNGEWRIVTRWMVLDAVLSAPALAIAEQQAGESVRRDRSDPSYNRDPK